MSEPKVILKKGRARPFFGRHPWVFSGSVQAVSGNPQNGDALPVYSHDGQFIAWGLYNPVSQIRVRLYSWEEGEGLTDAFFKRRIQAAVRMRTGILGMVQPQGACRLVNSEADGMSGLTVDRYGDYLTVQWGGFGIHRRKEAVLDALEEFCRPKAVYGRLDKGIQELEGIVAAEGVERGRAASGPVRIEENGLFFELDLLAGQKTGAFLDQRDNRRAIRPYAAGRRCLDLFGYTGGFALNLAVGGASEVISADVSRRAVEAARRNGELNDIKTIDFREEDAFEALKRYASTGERFGLIVLDPPKFAKAAKDKKNALQGYARLNELAVNVLESDGILLTCSCSGLVSAEEFMQVLAGVSEKTGRLLQAIERRGAAPDHPVCVSVPETEYLKCFICRVG